jgi:hypothetical protein
MSDLYDTDIELLNRMRHDGCGGGREIGGAAAVSSPRRPLRGPQWTAAGQRLCAAVACEDDRGEAFDLGAFDAGVLDGVREGEAIAQATSFSRGVNMRRLLMAAIAPGCHGFASPTSHY